MMRPEFAFAIDPIFEYGLQRTAELDRGQALEPYQLHIDLLNLFDRADGLQGTSPQWQLAKYALAAWIDEIFLGTPWPGAEWWRDNILEMQLFQSRVCSVRFFEMAQQASAEPERDALEVFVNCVQLGFRGALGQVAPLDAAVRAQKSVPAPTIQEWLKQMEPRLDFHRARNRPAIVSHYPQRNIEGAPPLSARQHVIWWSLLAVILLLVNGWVFQT